LISSHLVTLNDIPLSLNQMKRAVNDSTSRNIVVYSNKEEYLIFILS